MKDMSSVRWRFIHRINPSESIAVEDAESARVLSRVLQQHCPGQWIFQEEKPLGAMEAFPVSTATQEKENTAEVQVKSEAEEPAFEPSALPSFPARPDFQSKPLAQSSPPVSAQAPTPPPPPASTASTAEASIEIPSPVTPGQPGGAAKPQAGRRRFKRYNVGFRVILVADGKTFRTFSENVSTGGMLLKQKIPQGLLNKPCKIFIGSLSSPENIEMVCRLVGDTTDPRRISFLDCDAGLTKRLESWILANTNPSQPPSLPRAA